jgi:hypothetical protein
VRRTSVRAGAALVICLIAGTGARADAGTETARPDRVLIISVPGLTWEDVSRNDVPNLRRLLDDSALADLATRTISRLTKPPDGYATLGAGTRAIGAGTVIDGAAFQIDETVEGDRAGQVFARRTGDQVRGGLVHLGLPEILEANDAELYDADIGALGDALEEEQYSRAVIANADGLDLGSGAPAYYRRAAVAGLMGSDGTVPEGSTSSELLDEDPDAPFGLRYDNRAVTAAFRRVWGPRSVVLVEASDLVRQDFYRPFAEAAARPPLFRQALEHTDDLVGRLLADVDLDRDLVIVVGPSHPLGGPRLTVLAVHEPGGEPGLLRSASTQRSGFVPLVDVAPTILDRLDIDEPGSMEGRPVESGARGGSAAERVDTLVDWDEQTRFRDRQVGPVATVFVLAQTLLAVGTLVWVLWLRRGWLARLLAVAALATLGYFPAVYLARLVPFHDIGQIVFLGALVAVSVLLGVLYDTFGRGRELEALVVALGAIVAVLLVDVLLGAPLQFNSALGYSPKVAGRFTGLGNLGFAALATSTLLLAALLAHRIAGKRGPQVAVGLLAIVFVVSGTPFWGSDVGATLSLLPAFGVTGTLLVGARLRVSTIVKCAVAALGALALFAALDLTRAPENRTHLGRLVERIGDEGWSSVGDVLLRRGGQSFSLGGSVWVWTFVIAGGLAAVVLWQAPGAVRELYERVPELRAATIGFAVVAVLGFAVNDSGIAVPGVMVGVFTSTMIGLLVRPPERAALQSPDRELVGAPR